MSATGRNVEGHERNPVDFYETPGWCTRAILPHLQRPRSVLDAGAGTGAILREAIKCWGPEIDARGIEKNPRAGVLDWLEPKILTGDFLTENFCDSPWDRGEKFDLVIANPPYGDAEIFAKRALELGVTVAFLLRLNWLASKKRAAFHRAHPSDVFVLPRRPSFTNGGTDATEYAWLVWGPEPVLGADNFKWMAGHYGSRGNRWFLLDVEDR